MMKVTVTRLVSLVKVEWHFHDGHGTEWQSTTSFPAAPALCAILGSMLADPSFRDPYTALTAALTEQGYSRQASVVAECGERFATHA